RGDRVTAATVASNARRNSAARPGDRPSYHSAAEVISSSASARRMSRRFTPGIESEAFREPAPTKWPNPDQDHGQQVCARSLEPAPPLAGALQLQGCCPRDLGQAGSAQLGLA